MTDQNIPPAQEPSLSPATPPAPLSAAEDGQWAMLAHFLNIILLIPAIIIYVVFKDRGQRVAAEGKEALNWTINVSGAVIILNIANVIFGFIPVLGLVTFVVFTIAIWAIIVVNLIFAIRGGLQVKAGGGYQYPLNYRWIK